MARAARTLDVGAPLLAGVLLAACSPSSGGGMDSGVEGVDGGLDAGGERDSAASEAGEFDAAWPDVGVLMPDAWVFPDAQGIPDTYVPDIPHPGPPRVLFRSDEECPPVDYRYRGVRPDVPAGTVLWTRRLATSGLPGNPRSFEEYAQPVVHPSGAVSMSVGNPLQIVTWSQDGELLGRLPSAPEPFEIDPFHPPPFISGPFRVLMARGVPGVDDVYWEAPESNPIAPVVPVRLSGTGYAYVRRVDNVLDVICAANGELHQRLQFPAEMGGPRTYGDLLIVNGMQPAPGWILEHDGDYLRPDPAQSPLFYEGCGFVWETWRMFGWGDLTGRLLTTPAQTAEDTEWIPLPDCGSFALHSGQRFDRHGRLMHEEVPGLSRALADGGKVVYTIPFTNTGEVGRLVVVDGRGRTTLDRRYVPSDFGLSDSLTPTFSIFEELGPNGILYMVLRASTSAELGTMTAIYLGPDVYPGRYLNLAALTLGGGRQNWAHTYSSLPEDRDYYYRYFATDQERAEAGVSLDAGVDAASDDAASDDAASDDAASDDAASDGD